MADLAKFDVPENSDDAAEGRISRRTLVKAGAVTAWTVPLIQVIAAAPAHAASSGTPQCTVTGTSGHWDSSKNLVTTVTLTNTGGLPAQNVQVTYTLPSNWNSVSVSAVGSGWTGTASGLTVVFTDTTPIAPGNSVTLTATLVCGNSGQRGKSVSIPLAVTWTGSTSAASGTITVTP